MKKLIFTLLSAAFLTNAYGQKTEFGISLNSGLFSFAGQSATKESYIHSRNSINSGYTNNPYGAKNGLCYGFSGNVKRISSKNFVLGLDLGYEMLRSKVTITSIETSTGSFAASGRTYLKYDFINLNPQMGYRVIANKTSIDILAGIDFALCLATKEKGSAITNGQEYTTFLDRKTINTDIRPRFQVTTNYRKMGVYVGYSFGLANYMSGYVGGITESYARLIRFGLTYQLK